MPRGVFFASPEIVESYGPVEFVGSSNGVSYFVSDAIYQQEKKKALRLDVSSAIITGGPLGFETLKAILEQETLDLDEQDSEGNTFLMLAAYEGEKDMIQLLLDLGANASLVNERGMDASPTHSKRPLMERVNSNFFAQKK